LRYIRGVKKFSRRQLLALSAALATAGAVGTVGSWWDRATFEGYRALSLEEALFLDALAEAAFPSGGDPALGGGEAGVSSYVDGILVAMEPTQSKLLRLSLHALDASTLPTHGSRFRKLPPEEAHAVFLGWISSDIVELRSAVTSVYLFVGMAYTSHPLISERLQGMFRCGFGQ
jgi:Gluconate 2-dehydrogenase subunit 3